MTVLMPKLYESNLCFIGDTPSVSLCTKEQKVYQFWQTRYINHHSKEEFGENRYAAHAHFAAYLFLNCNKKIILINFLSILLITTLGLLSWFLNVATVSKYTKISFYCRVKINFVTYRFFPNQKLIILDTKCVIFIHYFDLCSFNKAIFLEFITILNICSFSYK